MDFVFKRHRAFTLIEILVAMVISSVLVLGINASFRQSNMVWLRAKESRVISKKSRLFFNLLSEELSCLYLPKFEDDQHRAGFSLSSLPDGTIRLSFFTMNPSWTNSANSNLPAKVTYEFSDESETGLKSLFRTEQLFSGEKAVGALKKQELFEGFSGIVIQAYDAEGAAGSGSWKENAECRENPPGGVKFVLRFDKDRQGQYDVQSVIDIVSDSAINRD